MKEPFSPHLQSASQQFSGFAAGRHSVSREPHPALISLESPVLLHVYTGFPRVLEGW